MATDIPMLDFDPIQRRLSPSTTNTTSTTDGSNNTTASAPSNPNSFIREYDPGYSGNDDPYEARNLPNGPYETLTNCIATPETQSDFIASGIVRPSVDYRVRVRHARRAGGWNKFQFYTPNGDEAEFRTLLYGELSDRQAGTRIGAMGNFYTGGNDSAKKIIDGTSVKNIYCLHHPSSAPPAIRVGFDNQLNALSAMADMVGELSHKEVGPVSATAPDGQTPIIKCSGPQVYKDCSRDPKPSTIVQNTTTPITFESISSLQNSSSTTENDREDNTRDTAKIEEGALYPCHFLPDHTGNRFDHVSSVVPQPLVYDINDDLVPPWLLYTVLKPGVLVMIEGVPSAWDIPGVKTTLQFNVDSVRVIGYSNTTPQEPPIIPIGPVDDNKPLTMTQKRSSHFDAFNKSTKKPRVDDGQAVNRQSHLQTNGSSSTTSSASSANASTSNSTATSTRASTSKGKGKAVSRK